MVMVLAPVALVVFFFCISVFSSSGNHRRRDTLQQLSKMLGGGYDLGGDVVWGSALGPHTVVTFANAGGPSLPERWTEIVVTLPQGYPLSLHVHPRPPEEAPSGALSFADTPFEQLFLVEGAPVDVVVRLLDDELRAALLRHGELELSAADGSLKLALRGWLDEVSQARPALELAVRIADRVAEAYAAAERETMLDVRGAPYRAEQDAFQVERAAAARLAEVRDLEHHRRWPSRLAKLGFIRMLAMLFRR